MASTGIDWAKLLLIINSLAGPLITAVAIVAAVMFFRADRRVHTVCLLAGCVLIFVVRVAHVVAWLPGVGYFDRGDSTALADLVEYNNTTVLVNLVAWTLFAFGLLVVAMTRLRTKNTPA